MKISTIICTQFAIHNRYLVCFGLEIGRNIFLTAEGFIKPYGSEFGNTAQLMHSPSYLQLFLNNYVVFSSFTRVKNIFSSRQECKCHIVLIFIYMYVHKTSV